MVTLLPRQRMQRCGEVCHSVFALSVFASRLRGRGCFDQHLILPARRHPLPPLHTLEPHHIRPTHQIVFLRQGVGAAGRAAQPRVEHAPPVFAVAGVAAQVDAQSQIPPGGQDAGGIAGGIEVHFPQLHRNGGKNPPPCQHGPGRAGKAGDFFPRYGAAGGNVLRYPPLFHRHPARRAVSGSAHRPGRQRPPRQKLVVRALPGAVPLCLRHLRPAGGKRSGVWVVCGAVQVCGVVAAGDGEPGG